MSLECGTHPVRRLWGDLSSTSLHTAYIRLYMAGDQCKSYRAMPDNGHFIKAFRLTLTPGDTHWAKNITRLTGAPLWPVETPNTNDTQTAIWRGKSGLFILSFRRVFSLAFGNIILFNLRSLGWSLSKYRLLLIGPGAPTQPGPAIEIGI